MTTASKTKYYSLPVLSKEARRNSNLATNLATVGLFSALAACGSDSSGGTTNTDNGNAGGGGITAISFNAFAPADDPVKDTFSFVVPGPASATDTVTVTRSDVPSTRYDTGDADMTKLYVREGITTESNLGSLTTSITGAGTVDYTIDSNATFSFGNFTDGNKIATYFAIDSNGALKLTGKPLNFDYTPTTAAQDGGSFSFEVTASSGTVSASHTVTVQLGDNYAGTTTLGQSAGQTKTLGAGDDLFQGGAGVDNIRGGDGNDIMYGGGLHDILYSGAGNDIIYGGAGSDQMQGGDGDDIFYGGTGSSVSGGGIDTYLGNAGADRFVFDATASYDNVIDNIHDFSRTEEDKIVFENTGGNLDFNTFTISYDGNTSIITGYVPEASIRVSSTNGWDGSTGDKKLAADDFIFVDGAFADLA